MTPDRNERDLLEKDSDPSARREVAFRRWRKRTPDKRATRTDRRYAYLAIAPYTKSNFDSSTPFS